MATDPKKISAVDRTLEIIEALEEHDELGVTEIADAVGLSKGTVHTHLSTLRQREYLVNNGGKYRLSSRFLELGSTVQNRFDLYQFAKQTVDDLANETGERTNLVTEENGMGVCLYATNAEDSTDIYMTAGEKYNMHATATGKAILAFTPEERVREIVDQHGLPRFTENTITSTEELFARLAEIRDRKVAFDEEETISGLRCIASPIVIEGRVVGSVSVSGPASRFEDSDKEAELREAVSDAANVVELEFVFS